MAHWTIQIRDSDKDRNNPIHGGTPDMYCSLSRGALDGPT
jgi:hypothetical protein